MDCKYCLKKLSSVYGASGDEGAVAQVLIEMLSPYGKCRKDSMNNVFCEIDGSGSHIMLDAHIDQIGFVVTGIDDKGFIKVTKCGGVDRRTLLSHSVTVWGKQAIEGVISCQPPHLLNAESYKTSPDFDDISIDVGMTKSQCEKIVSLGDRITLKAEYNELLNDCVSASFLDNRSGVAAVIGALDLLRNMKSDKKITAVFSAQEEVGTRGAVPAAFSVSPNEAVCVDVSFAQTPDSNSVDCGKIGCGAMIGISPVLSKSVYSRLKSLAEKNNIPYQLEVMGEATGTNADVISVSESGVKTGLVSVPLKYMHTPIESVCVRDVENISRLLACYIAEEAE